MENGNGYDVKLGLKKGAFAMGAGLLVSICLAVGAVLVDPVAVGSYFGSAGVAPVYVALIVAASQGVGKFILNWAKQRSAVSIQPQAFASPSKVCWKCGSIVTALALFLLLPAFASAQEPTPEQNSVTLSSGLMRFVTPGIKDTKDIEFHLGATVHTPEQTVTRAFVRWTRAQGADDSIAGALDPKSFAAVVGEVSLSRALTSYLDATCAVSVSWSRDGDFDPADSRLWTLGCGVTAHVKKGSLSVIPGGYGPVGGKGIGGKLVIRQNDTLAYVGTYQLPFQTPALYRSNPGNYTFGLQAALKAWKFN